VSQFVLDDQLDPRMVRDVIARRSTARFVREFRPGDVIKDDRVAVILRTLRTPTFISIDAGFYKRTRRSRRLCILYFALRSDEQGDIPALLRRVLRLPEFRTRAARMGKVARVSREGVRWWQLGDEVEYTVHWRDPSRRPAGR
jgi:hypothetical protein